MSEIHDYQVDCLFLPVGSNPVPNAVVGSLLTTPESTIIFLHSASTYKLANRLAGWFDEKGRTNKKFVEVEESNADMVYQRVKGELERYKSSQPGRARNVRVGLNYTPGTKVMAVQAYRALEHWSTESRKSGGPEREVVFCYLDANSLELRFDPTEFHPNAVSFPVGMSVEVDILELLRLHNWETVNSPAIAPVLPQSAMALLKVYSKSADANVWNKWLCHDLFSKARKTVTLDPPFSISQSGQILAGEYTVMQPGDNWKHKTELNTLAVSWPDLPILTQTLQHELGREDAEQLDLAVARTIGYKEVKDFCRWLSGLWLESAVLTALQQCAEILHLHDCCMNLEPKELGSDAKTSLFEFDVVAMRGYQLFAFSCTTEGALSEDGKKGRGLLKSKLFEAYIRARQMGAMRHVLP